MKKPMLQFGLPLAAVWTPYFYSTKQTLGLRNLSSIRFGAGVLGIDCCCPSHSLCGHQ